MKKKKKYSLGTGKNGIVRNYIETPDQTMAENEISMVKARQKADNNGFANTLGIFGNMALQYGLGKAGGTKGAAKGLGQGFSNIFGKQNAAFGGSVGGVNVEVEGEEVGQTPDGQLIDFKGPSHEQGGIDINLPEGTEIFSKRITVKGKTMAERKKIREKKLMTLEKLLDKTGGDTVLSNSIKRTKKNNQQEESKDQQLQNMVSAVQQVASFAYGTGKNGIKKSYENGGPIIDWNALIQGLNTQVPNINGTSDDFHTGDPSKDYRQGSISSVGNIESQPSTNNIVAGKVPTLAGNAPTPEQIKIPNNGFDLPNLTGGDITGLAGTLYSAFQPMKNTQANRAGDTPNINAYKDFGNDAIDRIDEAKGYVSTQRNKALKDLETSRVRSSKSNRNSARGVNTQRALDLATDVNVNNAQNNIYDNFSKQMMNLLSQQAGFENQQDQAVMSGEQQRDLADRQDRDNYYTQLAQDISTKGEGIQTIGKMLNENRSNTISEKAVNDSSVNFKYDNGTLTDKAGNVVMSQEEILKSAKVLGVTPQEYINMINQQKNG